MKKYILTIIITFIIFQFSFSQNVPMAFKYQAVARDIEGHTINNDVIAIELSITSETPDGDIAYKERHQVTTNNLGLFSLNIGDGNAIIGSFNFIDWGASDYFLNVGMDVNGGINYTEMGSSQFLSVPYALYAKNFSGTIEDADADPLNEVQTIVKNPETNIVTMSLSGGSFVDEFEDGDINPNNELQTLTKNGNVIVLSQGGGSVIVTDNTEDDDADPNNELQEITKVGSLVQLSKDGGSFIDEVNDADFSTNNELQTISKTGQFIELSNGGGTVIDEIEDADADNTNELQTIEQNGLIATLSRNGGQISVADNDNSSYNEFQTITKEGMNITLSDNGGSVSVADFDSDPYNELQTISKDNLGFISLSNAVGFIQDETEDDDADTLNEIQELSIEGTLLSISKGNSINLEGFSWQRDENSADLYFNTGNVGIGTNTPSAALQIDNPNGFVCNGVLGQGNYPQEGAGVRMMWYPNKAVFRMGLITTNDWDMDSVGNYSSVLGGKDNIVKGDYTSISGGEGNNAKLDYSIIGGGYQNLTEQEYTFIGGGKLNEVKGKYSSIIGGNQNKITKQSSIIGGGLQNTTLGLYTCILGGNNNIVQDNYAIIVGGKDNVVQGDYSLVIGGLGNYTSQSSCFIGGGQSNEANGFASLVVGGQNNITEENYSIVLGGYENQSTAFLSTVIGGQYNISKGLASIVSGGTNNIAKGNYAGVGSGYNLEARSSFVFAIGQNNIDTGDSLMWVNSDPLFIVGNGMSETTKNNALTLYKNGNLTIAGTLTESSDRKLKTNIIKIENILKKVLQLDACYYEFKNKELYPQGKQIGLIAQDVQRFFPELVKTDMNGHLSLAYGHLSVILLQSIKEQQKIIEKQAKDYDELKSRIEKLEKLIKK